MCLCGPSVARLLCGSSAMWLVCYVARYEPLLWLCYGPGWWSESEANGVISPGHRGEFTLSASIQKKHTNINDLTWWGVWNTEYLASIRRKLLIIINIDAAAMGQRWGKLTEGVAEIRRDGYLMGRTRYTALRLIEFSANSVQRPFFHVQIRHFSKFDLFGNSLIREFLIDRNALVAIINTHDRKRSRAFLERFRLNKNWNTEQLLSKNYIIQCN